MTSRRDEIREVAAQIFADRGYASTSMRDLARACEIRPASLYSHFESKAQIINEVLTPFLEELLPRLRAAAAMETPGMERLSALIREMISCSSERLSAYRILFNDSKLILDEPDLHHIGKGILEATSLWVEVTNAGVEDGSIRSDISPMLLVRVMQPMVHGALDTHYDPSLGKRKRPSPEEIGELLLEVLRSGVAAPLKRRASR